MSSPMLGKPIAPQDCLKIVDRMKHLMLRNNYARALQVAVEHDRSHKDEGSLACYAAEFKLTWAVAFTVVGDEESSMGIYESITTPGIPMDMWYIRYHMSVGFYLFRRGNFEKSVHHLELAYRRFVVTQQHLPFELRDKSLEICMLLERAQAHRTRHLDQILAMLSRVESWLDTEISKNSIMGMAFFDYAIDALKLARKYEPDTCVRLIYRLRTERSLTHTQKFKLFMIEWW